MTIYEKLLEIQLKLKVPKNKYNKFGNFYYRNCESILETAKPLCKEYKVLIILNDYIENIGSKNYVVATASMIDLESNEKIEVKANAREDESLKGMNSAQITGSSSSYARKYALGGLLNLDDGKDADDGEDDDPQQEQYPHCAVCGRVIQEKAAVEYVKQTGKQIRCMECAKR